MGFVSETGSESFDKFLNLLGDSITLQGWAGYRGGLDTKSKTAHFCSIGLHHYGFYMNIPLLFFFFTSLSCLPADDTTGIKSIYTVYQGHELMFHVSTMLPYSKDNKQQVSVDAYQICSNMELIPRLSSTTLGLEYVHFENEVSF